MARPRDLEIDRLVVAACVELLGEVGRAGLTRAMIARRAGVSMPAVNRRYGDVEDILLTVARTPPDPPSGWSRPDEARSLRDFLTVTLGRMAAALAVEGIRRQAAELLAAAAGNSAIDTAFQGTLTALRTEGLIWVERARTEGQVRADVDGDLLLDLVAGAAYYRLLWRDEVVEDVEVESMVDVILLGAAPRPTQ